MADPVPVPVIATASHDPLSVGGCFVCLVSVIMEYLDVHSGGVVALCAIIGAICTVIGLIRSWKKESGDKHD